MKFDKLPMHAKQVIIEEFGELINSIEEKGEVSKLYLVNDFYVEVFYRGLTVYKISKIASSHRLSLYCPELDL